MFENIDFGRFFVDIYIGGIFSKMLILVEIVKNLDSGAILRKISILD